MPMIKDEEIRGYVIDNEYVCRDCVERDEADRAKLSELLLQHDIEKGDDNYYCIRCTEPIVAL